MVVSTAIIQEPKSNYEDVNFQMLKLTPNDGIMHHYYSNYVGLRNLILH